MIKYKIKKHHINLLLIFAFLLYSNILLWLYKNKIDDFAPKHIGVAIMLLKGCSIENYPKSLFDSAPAFYTFIGLLLGITGVNYYNLPVLPFQFFPYFVIIFTMGYELLKYKEKNLLPLILFTFVYFSQSSTGTHFIFLWSHGIGEILFFAILIFIIKIVNETGSGKYISVILLISTTLILVSYDVNFWLFLFVLGVNLIVIIIKLKKVTYYIPVSQFVFLLIYTFVLLVVYNLYVSQSHVLRAVLSSLSVLNFIDVITRFFVSFFGETGTNKILYSLLFKYPKELTYLYIIKYTLYLLIILFGLVALKQQTKKKDKYALAPVIFYFSMIILSVIYAITRVLIGQFIVTMIFYVALASIFLIISAYQYADKIVKILLVILGIWLVLNFSAIYMAQENNLVHDYNYTYIIQSSLWARGHIPSKDRIAFPDQLTFGWWFITYAKECRTDELGYLRSWNDIFGLYFGGEIGDNVYIPINYRANYINPGKWNILKPLTKYRKTIETNPSIKEKIYTNNMLTIVHT